MEYYQLDNILAKNADYNIIFGERSNGKTYATLRYALLRYIETGEQSAYIRRWKEDLRGKRAESLFAGHVANGLIEEQTEGKYNEIVYTGGKWYLSRWDTDRSKHCLAEKPFCFGFSLSEQEHDKSTSYPEITTIIFDEFLTRRYYLPDEFVLFMNLLSTIIRSRSNVKIFMLGNTVNRFCPYFGEFGLMNISQMKQGNIDVYRFGERGAVLAVEYCTPISHKQEKESNKYFCFNNEKLQMITAGKWEVAAYPHLPEKYAPKDVVFTFFIIFGDNVLQGNIIQKQNSSFCYIHRKTTPIKDRDALIYSLESKGTPNIFRKIICTSTKIQERIARFFVSDRVFFQDNETGELVRNYIMISQQNNFLGK